jgi:hypothetical protein
VLHVAGRSLVTVIYAMAGTRGLTRASFGDLIRLSGTADGEGTGLDQDREMGGAKIVMLNNGAEG